MVNVRSIGIHVQWDPNGWRVTEIVAGWRAARSGQLRVGDVITQVESARCQSNSSTLDPRCRGVVRPDPLPGDSLSLDILCRAKPLTLHVLRPHGVGTILVSTRTVVVEVP
jgi:C-terminal processing protease CtpA/Prc